MTASANGQLSAAAATWKRFRELEAEMRNKFPEREAPIRTSLLALIAREHVVWLGPPGSGKTAMATALSAAIGGKLFAKQFSSLTVIDEIFGPVSYQGLTQETFRRVTRDTLLDATISILDEIFKASSTISHELLPVLNERRYTNGTEVMQLPLEMGIGASNELPQDKEQLDAFWDRFLFRHQFGYMKHDQNFRAVAFAPDPTIRSRLLPGDLENARHEAGAIDLSQIQDTLSRLRDRLLRENIILSDRRWKQGLKAVRASAWLEARAQALPDDLAVYEHIAWQDPSQHSTVRAAIIEVANPFDLQADLLLDEAVEVFNKAASIATAQPDQKSAAGFEAITKIEGIAKRMNQLAQRQGAPSITRAEHISRIRSELAQLQDRAYHEVLGMIGARQPGTTS